MKTESKIQQSCYVHFNNTYCLKHHKPRYIFFSVPNEMGMVLRGALKREGIKGSLIDRIVRMVMSTMKNIGLLSGASDTIICLPGKVLFVEFKTEIGNQSEKQKEFEQRVKDLGLEYHLIRSLEEFKEKICKR